MGVQEVIFYKKRKIVLTLHPSHLHYKRLVFSKLNVWRVNENLPQPFTYPSSK